MVYNGSDEQIQEIRSDRMPEELWMEVHDILQETLIKTIPKVKKCKKGKWLSEQDLKIAEEKIEVKGKIEKECRVPKNSISIQSSKEQQGEIRKPS